ncbi:MAG: phosphatase PAP2 family protein [Spirochaetaceae bacterium]|nr:MAG: phosphatase PAP2 family protein [Spirochaetaceae bacterium]
MSLRSFKRFDNITSLRLQEFARGPASRKILAVIAHSADSVVLFPCLFALWWWHDFSWQSIVVPVAVGFVLSILVTSAVKFIVRRRRPKGEWGAFYRKTDPHSFPSGHASRTIAITLVVMAGGWSLFGVALLLWSLLVGLSRVILGVHYLYDVMAGYLLGLGIGAGMWLLMAFDILF